MPKRVLIGIPMHKGEVSSQVLDSTMMGASNRHEVNLFPMGLSLLAKCFNTIWIRAYMEGYDYLIIHHSDLGVLGNLSNRNDASWSDILIEKLEALNAAAICPVINIKSEAGLTSTAIETDRNNPYSIRRLTVRELGRLPIDHISREDMIEVMGLDGATAGALLINTGCLAIDLRNFPWATHEWVDEHGRERRGWPGFGIEDTVVWNKSGVPASRCRPEDWNFSHFLHHHTDWPYYATRDLIVAHLGGHVWINNKCDFGLETDEAGGECSIEEYEQS